MKKINKLLLPLATLVMGSSIVAPLITSCANNKTDEGEEEVVVPEVQLSDVNHGYIPELEKHEPSTSLSKYEAKVEYLKALKENPNIATEDYKYFIGQLPELFRYLQYDNQQMYPMDQGTNGSSIGGYKVPGSWNHTLNGLKAGLRDFEVKNNGLVSFTSGIETNFNLDIFSEYGYNMSDIGLYPQSLTGSYNKKFHFDVDLSVNTSFKNFTLDLKSGKSVYDVPYSVITPVWPSDLNQRDWSLSIAVKGSFVMYINDIKVLNLQNIQFKKKFDYRDRYILSRYSLADIMKGPDSDTTQISTRDKATQPQQLIVKDGSFIGQTSSPTKYIGTDVYLMDALTYLGTYTSYYMSDVMIRDTFKMVDKPVFIPCTEEDYRLAGWEDYDRKNKNSRLMDCFRYYKGRILFQLPSEYTSISDINNSYTFVPKNYNVYQSYGSSIPSSSYPSIIRPYSLPFGASLSNPGSFPFHEYYDATGKLVKDKVYVDVWFSPVYNGISTRSVDTKKDTGGGGTTVIVKKAEDLKPALSSTLNGNYNSGDVSKQVVDIGDRQISSLNENALTLDFVIRESNSDDSYLSVETHSEDYTLIKDLVEYKAAGGENAASDFEVFYIPTELSQFYEKWKAMEQGEWWTENAYADELGRYEGCTFSINVKIDSEAAEPEKTLPLRPNSKFMFGNWAIYDIQNNEAFNYDNFLTRPTVSDKTTGDPKTYPDARLAEMFAVYKNYNGDLSYVDPYASSKSSDDKYALVQYYEKIKTGIGSSFDFDDYAKTAYQAHNAWLVTMPTPLTDANQALISANHLAWTQYWDLTVRQSTNYVTQQDPRYPMISQTEYGYSYPFYWLQQFKERFGNDEYLMRGKMDIKSVTVDGQALPYEITDQELTFKNPTDITKGNINVTFTYTGPTDTTFYYSVANYMVPYWASYMDYINSIYILNEVEQGNITRVFDMPKILVPRDVYYYSVPFLAIAKEVQP